MLLSGVQPGAGDGPEHLPGASFSGSNSTVATGKVWLTRASRTPASQLNFIATSGAQEPPSTPPRTPPSAMGSVRRQRIDNLAKA